jgi:hypothetical protein
VDVVPAGVHDPRIEGLEGHSGVFLDGESIHIGPQGDGHARLIAPQEADHSGFRYPGLDLQAHGQKLGGYQFGGLELPLAQLRVHVKEAAELDDPLDVVCDLLVDKVSGGLVHLPQCAGRAKQQQDEELEAS